jgi:hypothetical protein
MKSILFFTLVSVLLLVGCLQTEGLLQIQGKIMDESTKRTIAGRKVIIQALTKIDDEFISSNAGDFITDSTGCFSYKLNRVKNVYWYEFSVVGDTAYACLNKNLSLGELTSEGTFLEFYLDRLTDFKIKINRISKSPALDTLYVSWKSDGIEGKSIFPYEVGNNWLDSKGRLRWIGGDIKSMIKTKVFANKITIVRWELFRDGRYKEFKDTILCIRDIENVESFKY